MDTRFVAFAGSGLKGIDALRERLCWAAAERRWQEAFPYSPGRPPILSPSGQAAPRCGAQLTQFIEIRRVHAS